MIDREKLGSLYDRYSKELLVYIYSFTGSTESAEDILHDSFVKLIRYSIKRDVDEGNIKALLYKISRNASVDYLRRNKKIFFSELNEETNADTANTVQDKIELGELRQKIESLLSGLDEISRSIFVMKNENLMTFGDIANVLGISERTAKRKMSSTLSYLANELEKAGFFIIIFLLLFWHLC